jgi:exosortase E/protease (VPEID-CTERM system)
MPEVAIAGPRSFSGALTISRPRLVVRSVFLILLLAAELLHFGVPLLPRLDPTLQWWLPLIGDGRPLGEAVIGGALVATFLSWPVFRDELAVAINHADSASLNFWLGVHLLCVVGVATWLACGIDGGVFTAVSAQIWLFAGAALLPATALSWSYAVLPNTFWKRWLTRSRSAITAGALVGIAARSAGYFAQMLWPPLCHYTFVSVELMLHALGVAVVSDPGLALIGTARFAVSIAPTCSGLEGIGLICVFIAAYLWFYRTEYRFPAALVLIPAGVAGIWILNAVRITLLILVGQWFSGVAVTGFHSVAGWIFFNLTAFGIVGASRHVRWITRDDGSETVRDNLRGPNPALPYLMPLLLTIGAAMLTAPFTAGFDAAYPVRVIVAGLAIWAYRDRIGTALAEFSWTSAGLGALCFMIWAVLVHPDGTADAVIAGHLRSLPSVAMTGWIMLRVAGAVITVPIVEELAFRGYLLRKLVASDFESVPFDGFTWPSFIISSAAFGVVHQSWIAGIAAGALFALAMYRRGRLADAVAAHATANALLACYIIATGYWSLWS